MKKKQTPSYELHGTTVTREEKKRIYKSEVKIEASLNKEKEFFPNFHEEKKPPLLIRRSHLNI